MQGKRKILLLVGGTILAGCNLLGQLAGVSNSTPLASLSPVQTEHPLFKAPYNLSPGSLPLLSRYYRIDGDEANYGGLKYKPRQSNFKGFEGWDVVETNGSSETRNDWLRLQLNRDSRVVVVWEKSELWLSGWQRGSLSISNKTYNTFAKNFSRGEIALGSPGKDNPRYFVLLAERGGTPPTEPPLPAGITERPQANAACPAWLKTNVWVAKGPDGEIYQAWHPQIDPLYWCYFDHDHGSDPAVVGYTAALEYVAKKFGGQAERHEGFKGFAVRDEGANLGWYVSIHSETGVIDRACARFHTVVIAVTSLKTGELQAELGYKGDFGATKSNQNNNPLVNKTCTDPRNSQQVTQEQIATQTKANKRLRVFTNGNDPGGYEQWDGGVNKNLGFSFWGDDGMGNGLGIDIRNPATGCADNTCVDRVFTGSGADQRTIQFSNLRLRYTSAIDQANKQQGEKPGYFWTDLYGNPLAVGVKAGDPGTIRQFIKPGLDTAVNGEGLQGGFHNEDAWRGLYRADSGVPGTELEGGIGDVN